MGSIRDHITANPEAFDPAESGGRPFDGKITSKAIGFTSDKSQAGFYRSGGALAKFADTDDDLVPMRFKAA